MNLLIPTEELIGLTEEDIKDIDYVVTERDGQPCAYLMIARPKWTVFVRIDKGRIVGAKRKG